MRGLNPGDLIRRNYLILFPGTMGLKNWRGIKEGKHLSLIFSWYKPYPKGLCVDQENTWSSESGIFHDMLLGSIA